MNTTHFEEQCVARGITSVCPKKLAKRISEAVRTSGDFVEYVFSGSHGKVFYRFKCADGTFYALVKPVSGKCITLYTQKMMKSVRIGRKRARGGSARRNSLKRGYRKYKGL